MMYEETKKFEDELRERAIMTILFHRNVESVIDDSELKNKVMQAFCDAHRLYCNEELVEQFAEENAEKIKVLVGLFALRELVESFLPDDK